MLSVVLWLLAWGVPYAARCSAQRVALCTSHLHLNLLLQIPDLSGTVAHNALFVLKPADSVPLPNICESTHLCYEFDSQLISHIFRGSGIVSQGLGTDLHAQRCPPTVKQSCFEADVAHTV